MSFLERMREAADQLNAPPPDPWRKIIVNAVRDSEAMSTAALLDLVGVRPTTSNARRLAAIMRELNFIPIQSRRLMPGGFRDTVTRGWARPIRSAPQSGKVKIQQGVPSLRSNLARQGENDAV
jgi:hypothetical protein